MNIIEYIKVYIYIYNEQKDGTVGGDICWDKNAEGSYVGKHICIYDEIK